MKADRTLYVDLCTFCVCACDCRSINSRPRVADPALTQSVSSLDYDPSDCYSAIWDTISHIPHAHAET